MCKLKHVCVVSINGLILRTFEEIDSENVVSLARSHYFKPKFDTQFLY